jgi:hypothetical protein
VSFAQVVQKAASGDWNSANPYPGQVVGSPEQLCTRHLDGKKYKLISGKGLLALF